MVEDSLAFIHINDLYQTALRRIVSLYDDAIDIAVLFIASIMWVNWTKTGGMHASS